MSDTPKRPKRYITKLSHTTGYPTNVPTVWYLPMETDEYMDYLEQHVAKLEEELRDMTAACELWKKRAQAAERTFILCYRLQQYQGAKLDRAVEAIDLVMDYIEWDELGIKTQKAMRAALQDTPKGNT